LAQTKLISDDAERPPHAAPLSVPEAEPVTFQRNVVRIAVCELRFPTLLRAESKIPESFHQALRKEYPWLEPPKRVRADANAGVTETVHVLRSRNKKWRVTFRPSAIGVETDAYSSFEEFEARLTNVLESATKVIDSDYFTRVGLRYLNEIPFENQELQGWVNDALIAPFNMGIYGTVAKYWQEVRGYAKSGYYVFRHGLREEQDESKPSYTLDFDLYRENVDVGDALACARALHRESFAFFAWSIGPKTREFMGSVAPKTK
jgi:uncharacterized protein (TIGR04255 family)